uniref:Putative cleavage/polyadenylation factor n=1 Tax=Amblyomma parvum TaxID=251391 RepID=A0A023FWD6_AMBPA
MGPPFTHVRTPMKAYFLGHVSPASQPDAYCEAVRALIEHARKVAPRTPLFINTMGWISGLGLSLLVDVIRWSRPTDVVQLVAEEGTTDLPPLDDDLVRSACGWVTSRDDAWRHPSPVEVTYHSLPGSTCRGRSWARVKREAMVLAYLGQRIGTGLGRPLPQSYHWLWNTVPMRVPWSTVAVHDCDNAVPKKELLHSLRGSVVALCIVPDNKLLETENPFYPKFVDDCGPYECLGYGLVRAIDPSERLFYISSPEPQERLAKVNALIRGDLHLPQTLLTSQEHLLHGSWAPYVARESCDSDYRGSTNEAEDAASSC